MVGVGALSSCPPGVHLPPRGRPPRVIPAAAAALRALKVDPLEKPPTEVVLDLVVAGAWVLIDPPDSYEGLGAALTIVWGVFLGAGSLLCAIANATRRYRVELPGLVLALGGIAIYDYLSWDATLTDSPGSGPRSSLILLLGLLVVARIRVLLHIDRQARKLADMRCDQ